MTAARFRPTAASLRLLAYLWALPTTAVGLVFALLALVSGGSARRLRGVLEVSGGIVSFLLRRCLPVRGIQAMTLGHVVLGVDRGALARTRAHERVHVRQCERWGPLFLPVYLLASLWPLLRGRNAYRDNVFEREAFGVEQRDPISSRRSRDRP